MNWPFDYILALPSQLTRFKDFYLAAASLQTNLAVCALKALQLLQEESVPTCGSCMYHPASVGICRISSDFQICIGAIKPWFILPKISLSQLVCSRVPIIH